jgi:GNAT superfamily N-acetyltransferase
MFKNLAIEPMQTNEIGKAIDLWQKQFTHFCSQSAIYPYWLNNTLEIEDYLNAKTSQGKSFVAKLDSKICGYLAYDAIKFHGSNSAICHFCGNAAELEGRNFIYTSLYTEIAKIWVNKGIANHYIGICSNDIEIKNVFFDIGFGAYLIDAFTNFEQTKHCDRSMEIVKAGTVDANDLYEVVKESKDYYFSSPIFLTMQPYALKDLTQLIETSTVFIARDQGKIIGFMNLRTAEENDIFRMSVKNCGRIDDIGAYIKQDYRGRNVGAQFMQAISAYCKENSIPCVHVDFETANLYANKFWKKYFTPTMLSLKRTLHSDSINIS